MQRKFGKSNHWFITFIVYTLGWGEKIKRFMFMDNLKLYGKSESEIKGLVCTVEVFNQDIGMEFVIRKCGVITMNRGKVKSSDGI